MSQHFLGARRSLLRSDVAPHLPLLPSSFPPALLLTKWDLAQRFRLAFFTRKGFDWLRYSLSVGFKSNVLLLNPPFRKCRVWMLFTSGGCGMDNISMNKQTAWWGPNKRLNWLDVEVFSESHISRHLPQKWKRVSCYVCEIDLILYMSHLHAKEIYISSVNWFTRIFFRGTNNHLSQQKKMSNELTMNVFCLFQSIFLDPKLTDSNSFQHSEFIHAQCACVSAWYLHL